MVAIPGGGETLGEHFASIVPGDRVVVFGLRRRVAATDALLDYVASAKAALAYVTDEGLEPNRRAGISGARQHRRGPCSIMCR